MGLDNAELNPQNLQRFNVATLQVSFSSPSLRNYTKMLHVFTSALLSLSWNQLQLAREVRIRIHMDPYRYSDSCIRIPIRKNGYGFRYTFLKLHSNLKKVNYYIIRDTYLITFGFR